MNIVTALETLAVDGIDGGHDRIIETVLSKLFVRGDRVYKAYKHRSADFADLADRDVRREYIAEDFFWNNAMAPEVYLELRGVCRDGDRVIHADHHSGGDDWYIVMQKIDTSSNLTEQLIRGVLSKNDLKQYTDTLLPRLSALTEARGEGLQEFFDKGEAHVRSEVIGACGWASVAGQPELSAEDVARAEKLLLSALASESYFNAPINTLSVVIDTNGENILFLNDGVSFIDVMPPKDAWRVHDRYFLICRTSADVSALGGKHADVLHETYGEQHSLPPEIVRIAYEIAAALIQVPYRKMVGQDDLAAKYADFVRLRCDDLEALLR